MGNCNEKYDYLSKHDNPFAPSEDKNYGTGTSVDKYVEAVFNDAKGRCRETQASTAFIWFTAAAFMGTLALTFLGRGKRGSNSIA